MVDDVRDRRRRAGEAFHGKPPRLFFRLLNGRPGAWGRAARAPRREVLDVLARVGLTITLIHRTSSRDPSDAYHWWYGDLVEVPNGT